MLNDREGVNDRSLDPPREPLNEPRPRPRSDGSAATGGSRPPGCKNVGTADTLNVSVPVVGSLAISGSSLNVPRTVSASKAGCTGIDGRA